MSKKKGSAKQKWINKKVERILTEGVRRNTHKPVSSSNPRRKVSASMA
jgi:hypothetical protein